MLLGAILGAWGEPGGRRGAGGSQGSAVRGIGVAARLLGEWCLQLAFLPHFFFIGCWGSFLETCAVAIMCQGLLLRSTPHPGALPSSKGPLLHLSPPNLISWALT